MPSAGMEIRAWYCQGTRSATYDDICADDDDADGEADGDHDGDVDNGDNLGDESGRELGDGIEHAEDGDSDDDSGISEQDNMMEWICDDDKTFCHLLAEQEMTYLQARRFCNRQGIDYMKYTCEYTIITCKYAKIICVEYPTYWWIQNFSPKKHKKRI